MNVSPTLAGRPKTKIVCTLGPSTESQKALNALVESGMSVARLNMSHGTFRSHAVAIKRVRAASKQTGVPIGIMIDVPGPKYRIGPLAPGAAELKQGDKLILTSKAVIGTEEIMNVSPPGLHRDASMKRPIFLDDGLIELVVTKIQDVDVVCKIVTGGRLTEGRSVTTPGKAPSQPFPDSETQKAIRFAAEQDADFVALSTITSASDIHKARALIDKLGLDAQIISKIERAEALNNFDSILSASDAIMVARGDLGVEVPLARVPMIQKDLISKSNAAGKPVITATQMMESMVSAKIPTRAEVTDVFNAIFDGTDAVMLSGETSVGLYPIEALKAMAEVAHEAESELPYESIIRDKAAYLESQTEDAISYDACRTAYQLSANLIVAFTESGGTAGRVSKYRPMPPILALTFGERIQRRLTLQWGVTPVIVTELNTVEDFFIRGQEYAVRTGYVKPGGLVVLVAGVPIGVRGGTNLLRVMTIPRLAKPA